MENKDNRYSRRKFMETAALAGTLGTIGLGSVLSSCKKSKSNEELGLPPLLKHAPDGEKLKAGLIGAGNRGTGAAFNFLGAGPNLEVTALADVFQERIDVCRERFQKYDRPIPAENCFAGFDSYKKLMETDVDVVILATPAHFRPAHFEAAVEYGKHVFMEKPVAVDPVGVRTILASAKQAEARELCVITGTQRRHQKDYIETFKQVANGAIGKIVSAKAYWNQSHVWFRTRQKGWSDMEYMLKNWNNFNWLGGDHILDTHVHNIDVINWFTGKYPLSATGYGGRHRRITGDQYDFFSVDFDYGNGLSSHSMCRQIDDCANGIGEVIVGTEGYAVCEQNANKIHDHNEKLIWEYEYGSKDSDDPLKQEANSAYIQEHIHLVTAIRTGQYVNEAEKTALSTLTAIMGRESAYTGKKITWDEIMYSEQKLGPSEYKMGPVDMEFKVPVPGQPHSV